MNAPTTIAHLGPEWLHQSVAAFDGQRDTNKHTGADYDTITLAEIWKMTPGDAEKSEGRAIIPSGYHDHDAREHARQREAGKFIALTGDIDSGNHPLAKIRDIVAGLCKDAAHLIYSSPHARPGDARWRIIIPIDRALDFDKWRKAQHAFYAYLAQHEIKADYALARAAQPVYLPNVPHTHPKTGEALRDSEGVPLFYERRATDLTAPALPIRSGVIATYIREIVKQEAADERERERLSREAAERRANRPSSHDGNIIDDFNRSNSIADLLTLYGYQPDPGSNIDWRSPLQTGESYATRIFGDTWVSLSASDAAHGVGQKHAAGCFGDAYDLFVHFEHGGDHKAAWRKLCEERRVSAFTPPPMPDPQDPGPMPEDYAIPDFEDDDQDALAFKAGIDPEGLAKEAALSADLKVVDAFDFEEAEIPPRPWVIPGVMLSGYTHMLVAPGGSGKSLFTLQLAITLATGEQWGEMVPRKRCRTLVINVEDDMQEQRRRLAAARRVMGKDVAELRGMIALAEDPESIIVARADPNRKTVVATPVVDVLRRYIIDNDIGVLIVDPFAETFEGDENSNSEVKWAMRIWRDEIARATGCAVYLVHHTTKGNENGAGNADIVRGAGAIVNSTRITATLMPMTTADAENIGIDTAERFKFVRYDDAKANQSLKSGRARWFEKVGVTLENGTEDAPADEVGALRPWTPPSLFDGVTTSHLRRVQDAVGAGRWRENQQSKEWVGKAVAEVMMMDPGETKDRKRIIHLLREWIKNDALRVVEDEDEKRMTRKFVVVGKWVE